MMTRTAFSPGGRDRPHLEVFLMVRHLFATAAILLAPLALSAADPENPFKKAEKGQWVSYKVSAKFAGMEFSGTVKQTVKDKDEKSVTIETTGSFMGMDVPAQKQTIDLTKPFNPLSTSGMPAQTDAKFEKKDSGKETLEIGGKKYECEWTRYKIAVSFGGQSVDGEIKTWMAKGVPGAGVVKTESTMNALGMAMSSTMELDKHGKD
jgi:hypothetical protein